jgi:hypothetical protein
MNKRIKNKLAKDLTRKMKKLSFKKGNVIVFEFDQSALPVYQIYAYFEYIQEMAEKYGCELIGIAKGINISVKEKENEEDCKV